MVTVEELQRDREAKARVNHETYKQLLAQVHARLKARSDNKFRDLVWVVPPLVPGRPVYNPWHAARYVSDKLRLGGFDVEVASGDGVHVLYIEWSPVPKKPGPSTSSRPTTPSTPSRITTDQATRSLEKLKARLRVGS